MISIEAIKEMNNKRLNDLIHRYMFANYDPNEEEIKFLFDLIEQLQHEVEELREDIDYLTFLNESHERSIHNLTKYIADNSQFLEPMGV